MSTWFEAAELASLDPKRVPHHIAFIPDGNRRWAKKRSSPANEGHRNGANTLMDCVKAGKELGVKMMTFYLFSTENWTRPPEEIALLMALFTSYLRKQQREMTSHGIKLETIGNLSKLPPVLNTAIDETKQVTRHCNHIQLVLAFNYGSRDELCRAFKAMLKDCEERKLQSNSIDESTISSYLDTKNWKDPDLLIRSSGELRISNYLLWQIAYTEIYVAPVLWPDFKPRHLLDAILDFQGRERRWGGAA